MGTELWAKVGYKLQIARMEAGLTQSQVAEKVGLAHSSYANVEAGKRGMSVPVLLRTAELVGVSLDHLFFDHVDDCRFREIAILLHDKPESFIIMIEKMIRLCSEEFENREEKERR